jgi:hypothetical protein
MSTRTTTDSDAYAVWLENSGLADLVGKTDESEPNLVAIGISLAYAAFTQAGVVTGFAHSYN